MKKLYLSFSFLVGCGFFNPDIPKDTCGDQIIDPSLGELCDDGNLNNDDDCHNDCTPRGCGDGFPDAGLLCFDAASPVNLGNVDLVADILFVGPLPGTMRFADLDNDGDLDYVVTAPGSNAVVSGLNTGRGLFQNALRTTVNETPIAISLAKIDDDNFVDAVVSRPIAANGGDVRFIKGFGDGLFDANVAPVKVGDLPLAVIAADLDQDGDVEIPVFSLTTPVLNPDDSLDIFSLTGDVFVSPATQLLNADLNATDIAIADLDDNGFKDIITANSGNNSVTIIKQGVIDVPVTLPQIAQNQTFGVTTGDWNGDNRLDIAAVSANPGDVTVNLQGQDGVFIESIIVSDENFLGMKRIATTDLNHDGVLDLVVSVDNGSDSFPRDLLFYLGEGDGTFNTQLVDGETAISTGIGSFDIFIGDLNGDSFDDIAVLNTLSNDISIILANP